VTSDETKDAVMWIKGALGEIKRRLNRNSAVYFAALIIACLTAYVTWRHDKALDRLALLASDNYKKIIEFRARQDAQDTVIVNYIQDTVTAMNKLQQDNQQKIKVPKAPNIRLPNAPPPTASDLERPVPIPVSTPRPNQTPKVAGAVHHSPRPKKKATPAPTPWWKYWKQTR
jgi:hypothetical protein